MTCKWDLRKWGFSNLKWWISVLETNIQLRFGRYTAGSWASLNNIWWFIVQGTFLLLWVWLALPGNLVARGSQFSEPAWFRLKQAGDFRLRFHHIYQPGSETLTASTNRNQLSDSTQLRPRVPFCPYLSVHLSGCPRGARSHRWPLSAWHWPWWCQSPCPAAGTAPRPTTPPQRSPPCCSSGLLCPAGPVASRGWRGSARWVRRCGSRRRWSPRAWCSTLEGPGRTRASQSWWGPGWERFHTWKPRLPGVSS